MSLRTCQELERGAGTRGGDRAWWGQNLEKGKGPQEGHKLGRRPRHPGRVMRQGGSGPGSLNEHMEESHPLDIFIQHNSDTNLK